MLFFVWLTFYIFDTHFDVKKLLFVAYLPSFVLLGVFFSFNSVVEEFLALIIHGADLYLGITCDKLCISINFWPIFNLLIIFVAEFTY